MLACPRERAEGESGGLHQEELPVGCGSAGLRPGVSLGTTLGQLQAPPVGLLVQTQTPSKGKQKPVAQHLLCTRSLFSVLLFTDILNNPGGASFFFF